LNIELLLVLASSAEKSTTASLY